MGASGPGLGLSHRVRPAAAARRVSFASTSFSKPRREPVKTIAACGKEAVFLSHGSVEPERNVGLGLFLLGLLGLGAGVDLFFGAHGVLRAFPLLAGLELPLGGEVE